MVAVRHFLESDPSVDELEPDGLVLAFGELGDPLEHVHRQLGRSALCHNRHGASLRRQAPAWRNGRRSTQGLIGDHPDE
ncbi:MULTISPECIES: hypothetical protein [unclassified Streptomyces]|uniref:hypothetical protein n=1 Tax=unclassified Streptomyces TaxID=2593676 RepID=UPI0036FBFAE2